MNLKCKTFCFLLFFTFFYLKVFGRVFYKKLVGLLGAKPLTTRPKILTNIFILTFLENIFL